MFEINNDYIVKIRREIHEYPETDFDLPRTVAVVKRELEAMNIPYTEKYGKGSVVAYINPDKTDFTIGLRADMDALNILEQNDVPYKSRIDGKMHACGHDAHTAILLGAAKALKEMENALACRVKLLFQPSEEGMKSGAIMMIENGVMEDIDIISALHVNTLLESGTLGICKGAFQASSRHFNIEIFGKGAHVSTPHRGIDALALAVRLYNEIQLICTSEIPPKEACICSICRLDSGTSHNIIPDYAFLQGTLRAFNMDVENYIITQIEKFAKSIADNHGAEIKITAPLKSVCLYNDPDISDLMIKAMEKVVGKENVKMINPQLSSEDFSRYLEKKPGVMINLGIRNEEKGITAPLHNSKFDVDENALKVGAETFVRFVLDNMNGIEK